VKKYLTTIILNVDAPELAKFVHATFQDSKVINIESIRGKDSVYQVKSRVTSYLKVKIIEIKIFWYPLLLACYRLTLKKVSKFDRVFRRAWNSRKAIRPLDFTQLSSNDSNYEIFSRKKLHLDLSQIKPKKVSPRRIIITFSRIADFEVSFSGNEINTKVFLLDYDFVQSKAAHLHGSSELISDMKATLSYVPGYWSHGKEHSPNLKSKSSKIVVFVNKAPILGNNSLDHLILSQAARCMGFKSILFVCAIMSHSQEDFVSQDGFAFEFRYFGDFLDISSFNLLRNLEGSSEIIDFTGNQNLRFRFASELLGITYRAANQNLIRNRSEWISEITRTLLFDLGSRTEKTNYILMSDIEIIKNWHHQVNSVLDE